MREPERFIAEPERFIARCAPIAFIAPEPERFIAPEPDPIAFIAGCIPIACIARIAAGLPGTVSAGTLEGDAAIPSASAASTTATPAVEAERQGSSFSAAIRAPTRSIQVKLIAPSANSAAIRAQQQPRHQPPCSNPIRSAPERPGFQLPTRNAIGLRQRVRQAFLAGVNS